MPDFVPSTHLIRNRCIYKPDVKGGGGGGGGVPVKLDWLFLITLPGLVIKLKAVNCERHASIRETKNYIIFRYP